jgi:hypothetical protein
MISDREHHSNGTLTPWKLGQFWIDSGGSLAERVDALFWLTGMTAIIPSLNFNPLKNRRIENTLERPGLLPPKPGDRIEWGSKKLPP